jgi:NAD(P)-dependent dehydrogenase (short-subunit alcohol dehydrogenase family)
MDLGLQGKHAIVTGGSRGIGKAIARELAREGVDVAIVARNKGDLEATARELAAATNRRIIPLAADVTSKEQVDRMVAEAAQQLGGLHILVNSGSAPGGSATATGPIDTVVNEDLIEDFNVKYVGALRCSRAVIPFMKTAGWGRIINISGGNARNAGNLSGGARNAALVHMTKTLAVQMGRHGITVNCIHPGTTRTERTPSLVAARAAQLGVSAEEGAAGLCSGLAAGQCHLPHGGRFGGRVRRGIPGLGKGLGGLWRAGVGKRRGRAVGILLSSDFRMRIH